jgi:hypothetical protein
VEQHHELPRRAAGARRQDRTGNHAGAPALRPSAA